MGFWIYHVGKLAKSMVRTKHCQTNPKHSFLCNPLYPHHTPPKKNHTYIIRITHHILCNYVMYTVYIYTYIYIHLLIYPQETVAAIITEIMVGDIPIVSPMVVFSFLYLPIHVMCLYAANMAPTRCHVAPFRALPSAVPALPAA